MNYSLQHRKIIWTSVTLILLVSLAATALSLVLLYQEALRSQRVLLADTVQSITRFVAAMHDHEVAKGEPNSAMAQLLQVHGSYGGFGATGEFLVARRHGDQIEYVVATRHSGPSLHVPWNARDGEPMRRALQGLTGTAVARDYRGEAVLAAYQPLPDLQLGLVAKVDMSEIRAPFILAGALATLAALILALAASMIFRRRTSPLISAIEESERHYRALFDLSPDGVLVVDPETRSPIAFNQVAHEQLGYTREEFAELRLTDIASHSELGETATTKLLPHGGAAFETLARTKGGEVRRFHVRARCIPRGTRTLLYCIQEDITERRAVEEELAAHREHLAELVQARTAELEQANVQLQREIATRREAEERLRLADVMFRTTEEGVFVTNAKGTILAVNPAFTAITGYSEAEAVGNNPRLLKSHHQGPAFYRAMWTQVMSEGRWSGRLWNRRKNGEAYLQQLTITLFRNEEGRPANFVAVLSDITELHEKERHIHHQAYHDALTDLPNRALFRDRLTQALAQADRSGERVAVIFLDLDRFKVINDTLGHNHGDKLLQAVAERLTATLRFSDTVSRFGGDEFVVLLQGVHDVPSVEQVAAALLNAFANPFRIEDRDLTVTPSIGIALFPDDGTSVDTLLRNADAAMYRAKERRNGFQFYTADINARAHIHLALENDLRHAVDHGELELHYQPRVSLRDGRVTGMEALVRWRHPQRGLILPAEFIPLAEETGLIAAVGQWVLDEACRQTRAWQQAGHPLRVSVNISARQFNHADLMRKVDEVLRITGLEGRYLEVELTESLVMQQPENTIEVLMAMKQRGICIAVDDFGTGYSSLSYLRRFPIDILKIDRSFIHDIPHNADACAIAETIAALGRSLRMEVIAEGVETAEQLAFLRDHRCDSIQGYYFSPPLPPAKFLTLVEEDRLLSPRAAASTAA